MWLCFDAAWYRGMYPDVYEALASETCSSELEHYLTQGQRCGFSPNRWFDEGWYRQAYADVRAGVAAGRWSSGFHHYASEGFAEYSPHWLFSEAYYRRSNPDLTAGAFQAARYVNGYDHYLSGGEEGVRSGSLFFDPHVYAGTHDTEEYSENRAERKGVFPFPFAFADFLFSDSVDADRRRCSWYFDPVWYLENYPEITDLIDGRTYGSALHHYLVTGQREGFSPQAGFSEAFYRKAYPDVAACIEARLFRSGYEHFISIGALEGRLPEENALLADYASQPGVRADIESGFFRNPFEHWVAAHARREARFCHRTPDETHSKIVFREEAVGSQMEIGRRVLDFSCTETPVLSVLLVLHDQFPLTMLTLESLRDNFAGAIELVIVDSGSGDETVHLERYVHGARIIHLPYNAGFLLACNMALENATADAVLYLNNDVRLLPGAIAAGLSRLKSDPRIGAVGAKIVRTNGLLQEAGSIVWRDGATYGYLRDRDPCCPEANFVRDVDYCSGAFLLVATACARELGGFDPAYCPAYFEEVDFCLRLIRAGYRVVYDPSVVIEHLEYGSSSNATSHALMQRNRRILAKRQSEFLKHQLPAHTDNAILARARRGTGPRVLFVEDRIPLRTLGSGYVRSNEIVRSLVRQGCAVTIFPVNAHYHSLAQIYGDMPETVEALYDRSFPDLDTFLEERAGAFDVVWIGRTHNLARILPVLHKNSRYLPQKGFVLDTEAVIAPREIGRDRVLGQAKTVSLDERLQAEFEGAFFCQQIVAVTARDADFIRRAGHENVRILGHALQPTPTARSFAAREGLLFVGAILDDESPNLDALLWFMKEAFPLIRERLGADVRLTAVGHRTRGVNLRGLAECDGLDIVEGADNLSPFYDRHRVFVAPTRFAGGLPYKVHESAAFGLPVVASDLLIAQLGWQAGRDIGEGGAPDAVTFANTVEALYTDEAWWRDVRDAALRRVTEDCDPGRFDASVRAIVQASRE